MLYSEAFLANVDPPIAVLVPDINLFRGSGRRIDVDFRPNPPEFTITIFDTTEIRTGDSFLTNVHQIAGGVAAGFVISEIKK